MKVFITVSEVGSFNAASELLNISPVMVGKHVRQLEKRLGVSLIHRTTRKQSLTEAGRIYLADCKDILERIRVAESLGERLNNHPCGKVRITAPNTLGSTVVATVVVEFLARYPDVQVELALHDRVSNLIEEGFDIAIRIGDLRESSYLVARRLLPYRMLICASPSYISRHGRPVVPSDLARHNCLNHLLWTQETGWHSLNPPTETADSLGGLFSSNNGHALRNAAIAGCGIVMLPHALLWQDVQEHKLVTLLDDFLPCPRSVHLLYPYDRQQLPKVARLVDMLVERMGEGPWEPEHDF